MVAKQADSKQGLPVVDLPQFGFSLKQDRRETYVQQIIFSQIQWQRILIQIQKFPSHIFILFKDAETC